MIDLSEYNQTARLKIEELTAEITRLKEETAVRLTTILVANREIETLRQRIKRQQDGYNKLHDENKTLHETNIANMEREKELFRLRDERETLLASIEQWKKENDRLNGVIARLHTRFGEYQTKLLSGADHAKSEMLRKENNALKERERKNEKEITRMQAVIIKLQGRLSFYRESERHAQANEKRINELEITVARLIGTTGKPTQCGWCREMRLAPHFDFRRKCGVCFECFTRYGLRIPSSDPRSCFNKKSCQGC